jgi:hypothetical protein
MEAMKKDIARLNAMLGERCMKDKRATVAKRINQRGHNTRMGDLLTSRMDLGIQKDSN